MLDQEVITHQLALLATHRRTLAHLLRQAAQYGGEVFAPPQTANGIAEARQQIRRIKAVLHKNGVSVEDEPNDKTPRRRKSAQTQYAGGDQITVGAIVGSTAVAIGAGAQATATIFQMPRPEAALRQLRAPVNDFVGREREIDQLVQALSKASGAVASISGVRGMGGIGKTELAYVVAYQLKDSFPDAQLLVELRGTSSSPLTPEQALQQVILALDPKAELSDDLSQLQGRYCSVLTGKRVLIFADDAKDVAQVRSLMPPPGSALLVTSRNRFSLPGMVALDLRMLLPEEAEKLLLEICPRIGSHASELATLCGYLPLALRVSAGLLKENDSRDVARYLEQLRAERLKHLSDPDSPDDPQASVEASLRLSYDALVPAARSALCQMGVFPTSFDLEAAKAVVIVEGDVAEVLELLQRRHLLEWDATVERYGLHDLVRIFGAARLEDADAMRLRHARYYATVVDRVRMLRARHSYKMQQTAMLLDLPREAHSEYLKWLNKRFGNKTFGNPIVEAFELHTREDEHIDAAWEWVMQHAGCPEVDELLLTYNWLLWFSIPNAMSLVSGLDRIRRLEAALAAACRLGDKGGESIILSTLVIYHIAFGDAERAVVYYEQRLEMEEWGSPDWSEGSQAWFSRALKERSDLGQITEFMQASVDRLRKDEHRHVDGYPSLLAQLHQHLAASQEPPPAENPDER